eukprot:Skav211722  [mRNA]  locus=scaffold2852:828543:828863:- [translate_table: standard]
MASPLKFRDVETFLPSFAQVPGSLRDALDPAPSLRCVDTGRQQQPSVPSPRQLQLDASRARKQTARGWACARAQELQHVTELPVPWAELGLGTLLGGSSCGGAHQP